MGTPVASLPSMMDERKEGNVVNTTTRFKFAHAEMNLPPNNGNLQQFWVASFTLFLLSLAACVSCASKEFFNNSSHVSIIQLIPTHFKSDYVKSDLVDLHVASAHV
jgi:hypothetical protein